MALVEIITDNLYAGANLRKLEVGAVVEVDEATAERWKATGKAKETDKKKGEKLFGESVPAASQHSDLLEQLAAVTKERDESLEQVAKLTDQAAAEKATFDEQLAAVTKERDESLEQVAKLTDQAAAEKATFDEQLAAVTKRAEEAEAALAEATKKAK